VIGAGPSLDNRFEDQERRAGVPQNVTDGLMGHLNAANESEGYGRGFRFMPDVTAPWVGKMAVPHLLSAPTGRPQLQAHRSQRRSQPLAQDQDLAASECQAHKTTTAPTIEAMMPAPSSGP
jgi:hypothetical protein